MMWTHEPDRQERFILWGLSFLIVTVPLLPYRYIQLPAGVPVHVVLMLRHLPTIICILLGALWLWWRHAGFRQGAEQLPMAWPIVALLLAGLLSAMGALEPAVSIAKTLYYFVSGGVLFIVLVDTVRKEDHGRKLLYCLLGTGYLVAIYGIVEFVVGHNLIYSTFFNMENEAYRRLVPDPWFERRIVSTVGHPVYLGAYLALLLPLSVAAVAAIRSWRLQAVLFLGSLSLAGALLLTFSRGAWIAAAVGVALLLLLSGSRRLLGLLVAMIVLAAGVLSLRSVADVTVARAKDAYHSYVLNFASTPRGVAYAHVAAIASREPMAGLGTGMYRFAAYDLRRELDIPTPLGVSDTPDNMYLMWLAENGGIGLVAAVYVIVALLQTLWRWGRQRASGDRHLLSLGFIAAFAGFVVNLMTVDGLYFPLVRTVFWIMAGVAVVVVRPPVSTTAKVVPPVQIKSSAREEKGKSG